MSIFDSIGQQAINPQQALSQLRANPAAMLAQRGLNIPAGMNNPQQIVQHLVNSGQVPQSRLTQAMQMMQSMGRR